MTNAEGRPPVDEVSEADLAERWIDAEDDDDAGLDPTELEDIGELDANPADVIDQAIRIPLPDYDDVEDSGNS